MLYYVNVKMPILTFTSMINFMLSWVDHEFFITSGPGHSLEGKAIKQLNPSPAKNILVKDEPASGSTQFSLQLDFLFGLRFYILVNSYGLVETFSSPNHTFSWASLTKPSQYFVHILWLVTDNKLSWIRGRRMTEEIISWSISKKYGTGPGSNLRPLDLHSDSLPTALRGQVAAWVSVVLNRTMRMNWLVKRWTLMWKKLSSWFTAR